MKYEMMMSLLVVSGAVVINRRNHENLFHRTLT